MTGRNPVVTGTGIICAAGSDVKTVWQSLRDGRSGLGPLTLFPSSRYERHSVGEVRENVDTLAGDVRGSRSDKLAWIAACQAIGSAGFDLGFRGYDTHRVGVMLGATVGGMFGTEQFLQRWLRDHKTRLHWLRFHECAGAADLCATKLGALGPCATISNACAAGAMAIMAAAELIQQGEADVMLAGAADSLSRLTLNGFGSLLLLDPNGCQPFDARRAGISLGEGAGILILEAEESARARGATILARLEGWGASCDAFHATAPDPEGQGATAAIERALCRAGAQPAEIDFISAHGTGTPDNDAMEARALKRIFGDKLPPFASIKRLTGHTLAASGAIKAVLCVESLRLQSIPPSLGFVNTDPALGLEPTKAYQEAPLSRVLSNSFGFGGNNAALVFARAELPTPVAMSSKPKGRFAILGRGIVSAAGTNIGQVAQSFQNGGAIPTVAKPAAFSKQDVPVYACGEFSVDSIPLAQRRKLSRFQKMALVAARQSLEPALTLSLGKACTCIGTGLGSLSETAGFLENLFLKEGAAPRPGFFVNSVHNSAASQLAIDLKVTGLNSTFIHREISFEAALWQATTELAEGRAERALAGSVDELNPYQLAAGDRWGWWNSQSPAVRPFANELKDRERPIPGEGCAIFTLGRTDSATEPLAFVSAVRIGRWNPGNAQPEAEARWILETLERYEVPAGDVDCLLMGANGLSELDRAYETVCNAFSSLVRRPVACAGYKHGCGEHYSASAFGFFTAVGLVRGEIRLDSCRCMTTALAQDRPCRAVVLYTLSSTGSKAMCCVCK